MAQRSIRSAVLILRLRIASPLRSQIPKCSRCRCKHRITCPTVSLLRTPGLKPHGVPVANLLRTWSAVTTRARPESFPALGARFPGGGGVCSGVIFKNLHLTERGGAWNGRCDIGSLTPEAPAAGGSSSSSSLRISPASRTLSCGCCCLSVPGATHVLPHPASPSDAFLFTFKGKQKYGKPSPPPHTHTFCSVCSPKNGHIDF